MLREQSRHLRGHFFYRFPHIPLKSSWSPPLAEKIIPEKKMKKTIIFAFRGNQVCFVHVLLNTLAINARGGHCRIVLEGEASGLVPELRKHGHPLHSLYKKVRDQKLIHGICKACALKFGTLAIAEEEGIPVLEDMSGHAGMARYIEEGWEIITL